MLLPRHVGIQAIEQPLAAGVDPLVRHLFFCFARASQRSESRKQAAKLALEQLRPKKQSSSTTPSDLAPAGCVGFEDLDCRIHTEAAEAGLTIQHR
jgi:hypothetical protein